ncbi:MAG: hypothetical protein CMK09_10720 [Ponticaulis sp.]|nr:hypothetical protein [Ponticaulis sp.]|tara:strand:- start:32528 stop:33595 length:1068 start_codon:yes stop_codon:yes gene_type:complete
MNPYNRFGLFSSSVTAAIMLTLLTFSARPLMDGFAALEGSVMSQSLGVAALLAVLVVFWMAFTEVILPSLFRMNAVRKLILGKYYIEGTWLQAEKSQSGPRIAVIDIQPNGKSFTFSGYTLDEDMDINSNVLIELSDFSWPFLTFKYRNSLSDGADGQREGVGEVQFEMNTKAARRFNGFSQFIKNDERIRLEGAKLVRSREINLLRTLQGREEIIESYWDQFFGRKERRLKARNAVKAATQRKDSARPAQQEPEASAVSKPVEPTMPVDRELVSVAEAMQAAPTEDRRTGTQDRPETLEDAIIPRRRVSDWADDEGATASVEVKSEEPVAPKPDEKKPSAVALAGQKLAQKHRM